MYWFRIWLQFDSVLGRVDGPELPVPYPGVFMQNSFGAFVLPIREVLEVGMVDAIRAVCLQPTLRGLVSVLYPGRRGLSMQCQSFTFPPEGVGSGAYDFCPLLKETCPRQVAISLATMH